MQRRRLDVALERALRVFCAPGADGEGEVVLADEGLADHVGICKGYSGVREKIIEVDSFIGRDLQEGQFGGGNDGTGSDERVG